MNYQKLQNFNYKNIDIPHEASEGSGGENPLTLKYGTKELTKSVAIVKYLIRKNNNESTYIFFTTIHSCCHWV